MVVNSSISAVYVSNGRHFEALRGHENSLLFDSFNNRCEPIAVCEQSTVKRAN